MPFDQNSSISDEELREMLFGDETENPEKVKNTINFMVPSYTFQSGIGFSDNPLYGPLFNKRQLIWKIRLKVFSDRK